MSSCLQLGLVENALSSLSRQGSLRPWGSKGDLHLLTRRPLLVLLTRAVWLEVTPCLSWTRGELKGSLT